MSEKPALQCTIVPVTPFRQNCSIVWCTETQRGAVIDPGGETEILIDNIGAHNIVIEKILITHGHLDHAGGAADLAEHFKVPIEGPQRADQFWIDAIAGQSEKYGLSGRPFTPDRWLEDGDSVTVGAQKFGVVHCPGHTPGHLVFFHSGVQLAFVGDVLFRGSIGRSDLPHGDRATLVRSITTKLWPLGNDMVFVPGHGPTSTFGRERQSNPFVADRLTGIRSPEQNRHEDIDRPQDSA